MKILLAAVLLISAVAVGQGKPICHLKEQPKSGTMEFYNWLDEHGADCGDLIKIQEDEWSVLVITAKDSPSAVFKTKKEAVKWAEARLPRMPKPIKCRKSYHPVDHFPGCRPDWDSGEMGTGKNDIGPWDMLNACVADGFACTGPVEMLPQKSIALGPGLVCVGCDDGDRHVLKPGEAEFHECDGTSDECWSRTMPPDKAVLPECKPTDPPSAECWRPRDKAAVPQYKYGDTNHIDWTLPCNGGDASGEGGWVVDDKGCIHPEGWRAPIEAAVPVEPCSIHDYYGRCDRESSKRHDRMLADAFAEYMSCMDQTESEGCYFVAREKNGLQEEDFREHFHSEITDADMYRILNERMARIGCRKEFSEEFCKSHVDDYQRFKKIIEKAR